MRERNPNCEINQFEKINNFKMNLIDEIRKVFNVKFAAFFNSQHQ